MPERRNPGARIAVAGVVHRYAAVLALNGVTLDVAAGSFTTVLGPNGAGKSTLAQVLCGTLAPTAGTVAVDGADAGRRSGQGFIDQGVVLVPEGRRLFGQLSCRENLVLGAYGSGANRAETDRRLAQTLALMPPATLTLCNARPDCTRISDGAEPSRDLAAALRKPVFGAKMANRSVLPCSPGARSG